jgi:hypothetical protein
MALCEFPIGSYAKTMSTEGGHLGWRSGSPNTILKIYHLRTTLSHQDGCHSAVALLLKAALIPVSDYRLLGASGFIKFSNFNTFRLIFKKKMTILSKFGYVKLSSAVGAILVDGPNRRTHFWKRIIR